MEAQSGQAKPSELLRDTKLLSELARGFFQGSYEMRMKRVMCLNLHLEACSLNDDS